MTAVPLDSIKTNVEAWAKDFFRTSDVVSYVFADEDEPERYIVVLAAVSETAKFDQLIRTGSGYQLHLFHYFQPVKTMTK